MGAKLIEVFTVCMTVLKSFSTESLHFLKSLISPIYVKISQEFPL